MDVGRAVRILRESNEVRLGDLAKRADLSVSMLSMIECGQREPSLGALRRLAAALGVPLDVLLTVSQPVEGTLASSDQRANDFTAALRRLEQVEKEIRSMNGRCTSL